MKRFLQNCIILFLLAVLAGISIGITEVRNPGFALFVLGSMTTIGVCMWIYLEKAHRIVVGGMKYMLEENVIGKSNLKGVPRNRGSTSNYFLGRFTPAKVSIFKDKVNSYSTINANFLHKSDPVRSGTVFELGYENNPAEYLWLCSMNNNDLHHFLHYCVQNRMQAGIRYALNILKARANGERTYSPAPMAQIGGPNFQSTRKIVLC